MTVREATGEDLEAILELADAQRRLYARYEPVFWRPAPDAVARQRNYLGALIDDATVISLVAVSGDAVAGFVVGTLAPAPPVYHPGGATCLVDDFAVAHPADWSTTGADLLRAVRRFARQRGAAQIVIVSGHMDEPKRAALADGGLNIASEWWVTPLDD